MSPAAEELRRAGASVSGVLHADIKDPDTSARAVALARANSQELRGLVNCAAATYLGSLDALSVEDLDACYAVNVRGTFMMMQAAARAMRTSGGGSIVNVGSADSFYGEEGAFAYCTTKAAVLNMTRAAAMDLAAAGIRFNCVCPGVIDTPFFRASFDAGDDPQEMIRAVGRRQPLGILNPDDIGPRSHS